MPRLGLEAANEDDKHAKKNTNFDYLKLDANPKTIRFITTGGISKNIMTYDEHFVRFKNNWTRYYECPDDTADSSLCIICTKFKAGINGDVLEQSLGKKNVMQVIERDSVEKKTGITADRVKVFKFPPMFHNILKPFINGANDVGDRDYNVSMVKNQEHGKLNILYSLEPVTSKPTPLSDEDKALIVDLANVNDLYPPYNEKEITRLVAMTPGQNGKTGTNGNTDTKSFADDILGIKKEPVEEEEETDSKQEFFQTLRRHRANG